jgi:Cyanobacterial and plant NDH-1 subunit O.
MFFEEKLCLCVCGQDKIFSKSVYCGIRGIYGHEKRNMVRAIREKLENSLEAQASDSRFPSYLFETQGEIVDIKGNYALVKFGQVPTPNIWLKLEQLEEFV